MRKYLRQGPGARGLLQITHGHLASGLSLGRAAFHEGGAFGFQGIEVAAPPGHEIAQPGIEQLLPGRGEIRRQADFLAKGAHLVAAQGHHELEIEGVLGRRAICHLGHHVICAHGRDRADLTKRGKELVVATSAGYSRKSSYIRSPQRAG